jgi:hypothetical protein
MTKKEQAELHKSYGLCTVYDCYNLGEGKLSVCKEHKILKNANWRKYYHTHREKNLCISCTSPSVKGKSKCQYHLDYHNEKTVEKKERRKERGKCVICGRLMFDIGFIDPKKTCEYCLDKAKYNKVMGSL